MRTMPYLACERRAHSARYTRPNEASLSPCKWEETLCSSVLQLRESSQLVACAMRTMFVGWDMSHATCYPALPWVDLETLANVNMWYWSAAILAACLMFPPTNLVRIALHV